MEDNHKLCLYVSYYLSRFNDTALVNLGYKTWNDAFNNIAEKLNVKTHSVRNWRDEFDPIFGHRAGWYQRPLSPSRVRVAEALENLDEPQIREIVIDILSGELRREPQTEVQLLSIIADDRHVDFEKRYIVRGPTGRKAEEFFMKHFEIHAEPITGFLHDCRDLGCGYDFKIVSGSEEFYIEVKGIAEMAGGILLSDKEWRTAVKAGDSYYLCIIKNVSENPIITFMQNPGNKLQPKRNIYTTIQINWTIAANQF